MRRILPILFAFLLIPAGVFAARGQASFSAGRSLVSASSSPGNAYLAGISVVSTAPVAGDLSAIGGSIITAAPVQGDEFLLAGSVSSRAQVMGDVRAAGGSVSVEGSVSGDVVALGYSVNSTGRTFGNTFIIALNTTLSNGAAGPVTIYGNNISLAGDFTGNVTIFAIGRLSLAPGTTIHGKLSYEAPEEAVIPSSAAVLGGIEYTSASYLPDAGTSRLLAFVSIGFFLFARILGALILAGLLTGLFPRLAEAVVERAYAARPRGILLTTLLGFGIFVATPILIILLLLTFVGIGLAFFLIIAYALLVFLALLYAGILLGGLVVRRYARRKTILWRDGVLGMLVLSLIALMPFAGLFIVFLLSLFSAGTLLQLFFQYAFSHENHTPELL